MTQLAHNQPIPLDGIASGPVTLPVPVEAEAEEALLGALILDRDAIIKVAPLVEPGDFYRPANAVIYSAIADLAARREPPDLVTLTSELEQRGDLALAGGLARLSLLMARVPTAVHAEYYADLVFRAAFMRQLITVGGQIAALGYGKGRRVADVSDEAESLLFRLTRRLARGHTRGLGDLLGRVFDGLEAPPATDGLSGVPTGFTDLDALTGGLQAGDLVVLAARPGVGKTSFALSAAYHAAQRKYGCGIFSLEMTALQLAGRLLALAGGVPAQALRLRTFEAGDWQRIADGCAALSNLPLWIDETRGLSIGELRSKARRLVAETGCRLLIVDYLQLLHAGGRKRLDPVQEVTEITRGLKELAGELNVPVLALSQLSRAVENRPSKVPHLSDLRQSGSIEQDADQVIFIFREELYNPETTQRGIAEIHIAKHRNGPTGVLPLAFHAATTYFHDAPER